MTTIRALGRPAPFRFAGLAGLALLLPLLGCQPGQEASAPEEAQAEEPMLQSDDDKAVYAMGVALARGVRNLGLEENQVQILLSGLEDAALGNPLEVSVDEAGTLIPAFVKTRQEAAARAEAEASAGFLAEAAAMEGAEQTDSGLILRITERGDGALPEADSQVRVHYHGTLRDGTVFDSSVDRGQPATFPLDRVIPCWTEALQMIPQGSKAVIVCPAEIAYGDRGSQSIPPGAALSFEVELLEIVQ